MSILFYLCIIFTSFFSFLHTEDQVLEEAVFAGGCFWCMESVFEKLTGVEEVISGFSGGEQRDVSYELVSSGQTKHLECILIRFDPEQMSYAQLLNIFWRQIDPTDSQGQFVDRGMQYTSAIFYKNPEQERQARESKEVLARSTVFSKDIMTAIRPYDFFIKAEEYHQNYYKKNPLRYRWYRYSSGRDQFLKKTWKTKEKLFIYPQPQFQKPSAEKLKETLSDLQYRVTQEDATEPPFKNSYWDLKEEGIYVDIVSGKALFASTHKFDSGTGWPSFYKSIEADALVEKKDYSFGMERIEVRSREGDSHLGHLFPDGPLPTGLRYCINSAALRFIPREKLAEEGYEKWIQLFED